MSAGRRYIPSRPPWPLARIRHVLLRLLLLLPLLGLTALAREVPLENLSLPRPVFNPMHFFSGRTESTGVMENRRGEPTLRVRTQTSGRVVGRELHMEQDIFVGDKPRQHRSWRMRRLDAHHFAATASDMAGHAKGEVRGNMLRWQFMLATKPGHPLFNVQFVQHMYLQPGGQTLVNRTVIKKFGLVIGGVTEQFRRTSPSPQLPRPARRP